MPQKTIKPTRKGRCYEKALKYLLDHSIKGVYLAHGEVTGRGPVKGIRFGHAWIEDDNRGMAIDLDNTPPTFYHIDHYYQLGEIKADKVKRYTIKEAAILAVKTGHYGPWE